MQAWNLSERVNEPYIFECELDKPSKHHNFFFFFFVSLPSLSLSTFKSQTKCPSIESNALMMPRWYLRGGRLWECKVYFFILISLVSLNVKSNLYIMALVGLLRLCEAFSNLNYFYVPFLKLNGWNHPSSNHYFVF